ncbi:MAG: hypothetical protein Q9212_003016 [Teloschistes hypoglaucus]
MTAEAELIEKTRLGPVKRADDHPDAYELTTTESRRQPHAGHVAPYHRSLEEDEVERWSKKTPAREKPGLWRQFLILMSRAPLISRSTTGVSKASYGTAHTHFSDSAESSSASSDALLDHGQDEAVQTSSSLKSYSSSVDGQDIHIHPSASEDGMSRDGINIADGVIEVPEDGREMDEDPPDNSRYAQVRASVSAKDNAAASINTPRMWILSMLCAFLGSGTNLLFSLRYPSVAITPVIALVVVHPLGLAWDRLFKRDGDPVEVYDYGRLVKCSPREDDNGSVSMFTRIRRWLGQGRWNEKEHACVYVSSNVSFGFAFATDFGTTSGLGMLPITFNWAQIAYIGSPLLTPWWAAANVVTGLVIVMWIVAPILYYKNVLYSAFMPILSSSVFDNTGKEYDVSRILTPDYLFDRKKYEAYSQVYLPITYALAYGVQFAGLSALVTHTACWYGKEIWQVSQQSVANDPTQASVAYEPIPNRTNGKGVNHARSNSKESDSSGEVGLDTSMSGDDVHARLMRRYEDAPASWYLATFLTMLAIGLFVVTYYPTHLPWYGLLFALSITAVLFIPVAIVMAITNQHSSLYLICQIICGAVFPGRPVANMVFTTYCYISSAQGVKFSSDLKLGHYMKIPPKLLFQVQMLATLVSSFTQVGALNWMFRNLPSLCEPDAINGFSCPLARVHFNGSILWGVVGPKRFFGHGALYRHLVWFFLLGAIAPVIVFLIGRRRPRNSFWRKINLPVLFGSLSWIPPATGLNFSTWALVCFVFNSVIRKRKPGWWGKYTMTLSAALDSGLAIGVVVVFFGVVFPGWAKGFSWWGTEVFKQPGETFDS